MLDERRRQRALDELGILDTPPDERVDRVTRLAREIFDVPMVSVSLLDRDRQWRKSQIGLGGWEAPRKDSFCDMTVRRGDTLVVEDAALDERFADNPFVAGDPHLRFYAGHPIQAPGGEHIGTLCIVDVKPRVLDERQIEILEELAYWVQVELVQSSELDDAALVQRALSPARLPEVPGYALAAGCKPAGSIAGDFYDLVLHDDRLRLTLADVMGKGAGAAIIAAAVRSSLRTAPERSLDRAVVEIDDLLEADIGDSNMFVTAFVADLDLPTGRLSFIDAGHSLGFILHADGSWEPLRSTSLPLGMGTLEPRTMAEATLAPGDTFVCCSDGLLDVLDPADPYRHVQRVLAEQGPAGAVREAHRIAAATTAPDDVTVIVVRREA